jgi:signal transduction histidine kinase
MTTLVRVLVIGFAAVIALMAAAAIIGVNNARSTAASATGLVNDQLVIVQLMNAVEREQSVLNAAVYRLSRTPDAVDRASMLADLDQSDKEILGMVAQAAGRANDDSGGPDAAAWNRLQRAVFDFSQEARAALSQPTVPEGASRELFFRHEAVTAEVARLVELSYERAVETRQRVDRQADTLARESAILLGGCLIIALVCAVITVRIAARVFRQMESQTGELSRVSFRMLETQESTARRFSHELHDELGGSLTAIKSNLTAIAARLNGNTSDRSRIEDCIKLVDQSISNVRELSQLLRPTILDDFGLDAGLSWLADRFRERTGIEVDYESEFTGRLPDETETHLFRIVQEALTNVARHSGATRVSIHLRADGDSIRLTLSDNGRGLGGERPGSGMGPSDSEMGRSESGMGLTGMRARARSAGGELEFKSGPGRGVTIEVRAPIGKPAATPVAEEHQ